MITEQDLFDLKFLKVGDTYNKFLNDSYAIFIKIENDKFIIDFCKDAHYWEYDTARKGSYFGSVFDKEDLIHIIKLISRDT